MIPSSVALTRDVVIIVVGVLGITCAITVTALVALAYWKVARTLDAIRSTAEAVESSAAVVSRAAGSLVTGAGLGSVLMGAVTRLFRAGGNG